MSKVFNFKVAIFDLDDTLWNGARLFEDTKLILSTLKSSGVKLYIASFHLNAIECCRQLQIDHYFEDILYGRDRTKLDMIRYVMRVNPSIKQQEMVYFDDDLSNLKHIRLNTLVHAIHIGETGIRWEDISNGRVATVNMTNGNRGILQNPMADSTLDIFQITPAFISATTLPIIATFNQNYLPATVKNMA
jgi:predicted phosphatase